MSDLQSQIMMKTTQNQKLLEKNVSLTKHLNKLKEKLEKSVSLYGIINKLVSVTKIHTPGPVLEITVSHFQPISTFGHNQNSFQSAKFLVLQ